ncbi:MAG: IS1182 family transposase [Verrucomicrobiales bacterium]
MSRIIEVDYAEQYILPPSLEDWVRADHPARFIRDFCSGLDLSKLKVEQPSQGDHGRPCYGPELLLRVWLYGYYEKVRSCRKLEAACRERVGFIWLCGNQAPDHNTLWRFWNKNRKALRAIFKKTVFVAMEVGLVGLVLQAVDGTKIAASCSGRGVYDRESLQKLLAKLDEVIAELESNMEQEPQTSGQDLGQDNNLSQMENATRMREKVLEALARVEAGEAKHLHPLEPEARRMQSDGRNRFSYNAQAVVDHKERIIVAAEVVNDPADHVLLNGMIEQTEENTGSRNATTLADGGYAGGRELEKAKQAGREIVAPVPPGCKNPEDKQYHASKFTYKPQEDVVVCPQGRKLPFQRERTRKNGDVIRVYRSAQVCKGCPAFGLCTRDRHGRSIDVAPWRELLIEHGQKMKEPMAKALYGMRGEIVEPVFGWIKQQMGFRRWTVQGLDKVNAQWALLCAACNLKAIYRHWAASPRLSSG